VPALGQREARECVDDGEIHRPQDRYNLQNSSAGDR